MLTFPSCVRLTHPVDGYPVLEIEHPSCRARVAAHGAQVMEWTPDGHEPVIYLSPAAVLREGKAIRGGIPVCWPWFGPHPTDPSKPAHGLARGRFWELTDCVDSGASVELRFELHSSEATRALWNHEFEAVLEIRLGAELHVSLTTYNPASTPFTETAALHTYLRVGDVHEITVRGLDGSSYVKHAGGGSEAGVQAGDVRISGEIDRIYASSADLEVRDPGLGRVLHVRKHGSASTIVWNPGTEKAATLGDLPPEEFHHFVCVETANAPGAEVTVAPGGKHVLRTRIGVGKFA